MSIQIPATEDVDFLGTLARVLVDGDETDGRYSLVDMVSVPARHMAPLHVHHDDDEGFYVIDGKVTLHLPGRSVVRGPGEFFLAPRGIPHTYEVHDRPARWLVTSSPAGFERFVLAAAALETPDPEALAAVAARHGIEILGPPGMLP